jgi:PAS domain S-box-containing protein
LTGRPLIRGRTSLLSGFQVKLLWRDDIPSFLFITVLRPRGSSATHSHIPMKSTGKKKGKQDQHSSAEELLSDILEHSFDGIVVTDEKGVIKLGSKSLLRIFGHPVDKPPRTMQEFSRLVFPDPAVRSRIFALWKQDVNSPHPPERVFPVIGKDGGQRWCRVQISRTRMGNFIQNIQDVTEQKHIETALRDSEEVFRNLAEQSPNLIFIQTARQIVYANERWEEILGYTRDELLSPNFSWPDLIASEQREVAQSNFAKRMKGQTIQAPEYTMVTKSEKRIDVILSAKIIRYHGTCAMLGILTDVSDLKRTNAELSRQGKALEDKHAALKEVLAQIEADKLRIRKQITANVEKIVMPIVRRLRVGTPSEQKQQWDLLESSLDDLASEFGAHLSGESVKLSPKQMEISSMIRSGMTSKEIAESLHLSPKTVETQRNRIRKKFGISRHATNLVSFLQNLS